MLHSPDAERPHVAQGPVLAVVEVRLGCLEGEAVAFVTRVIAAVRRLPTFLNQSLNKGKCVNCVKVSMFKQRGSVLIV